MSLLVACQGGDDSGMSAAPAGSSLSIGERVDQFVGAKVLSSAPGAAVLIVKDGIAVHQKGYGLADLLTHTSIATHSQFELASVSKQFTALGCMLLFDRGQLHFDDGIRRYLPELAPSWETMTIRHLLSHQAGIPDYLNDIFTGPQGEQMTNRDIMAYFVANPNLIFPPGTSYRYSNSGFVVLAELIARVSGMSFREFMVTEIFTPLGMTLTTVNDETRPDRPTLVTGYESNGVPTDVEFFAVGDGGVVSTIDDLFLYQQALLAHQIVSPSTLEMAFTDQTINGLGYGFGWDVRRIQGLESNEHGGAQDGFSTLFTIVHDLDLTIIVLSNITFNEQFTIDLRDLIIGFYNRVN